MALARVKVWIPGDILTAADLNAEFNNILNNPISLISPTTGTITFTTAQNFPVAQVTSTGLIGGQAILQTTGGRFTLSPIGGSRVRALNGLVTTAGQGTFTAAEYALRTTDGNGTFLLLSTDPFTVSIGTAGPTANGRDVAAAFASTYVYWYAITTGLGSTAAAGIVSTSPPATGPVLPTGYQAWAFLAASPYSSNSTSADTQHYIRGEWAHFSNAVALLTSGTATTETNVSYADTIAPEVGNVQLRVRSIGQATAGTALVENESHLRLVSGSDYYIHRQRVGVIVSNDAETNATVIFPVTSSQGLLYHNTIITGTSGRTSLDIMGYSNPNGGF